MSKTMENLHSKILRSIVGVETCCNTFVKFWRNIAWVDLASVAGHRRTWSEVLMVVLHQGQSGDDLRPWRQRVACVGIHSWMSLTVFAWLNIFCVYKHLWRADMFMLLTIAVERECLLATYVRAALKLRAPGKEKVKFPIILWYV
jgi:hypothetical protein